jgi:hypothetical protein
MIDPEHPIGARVRQIAYNYFDSSSYNEFIKLIEEYKVGDILYTTVSLIPDNGRLVYNGFPIGLHVGRISWILQLADEIYLTEEEATKLSNRIVDLQSSGKALKGKEEMEMLHYMAALDSYHNGKPTGVVTSNDFKGSGPLMQAILMKDVDALLNSISYEVKSPNDPYKAIIEEIPGKDSYLEEIMSENGLDKAQASKVLREWVKAHTHPMMYGSGDATSLRNGRQAGSKLNQEHFKEALTKGLPATAKVLGIIKAWSKELTRVAGNNLSDRDYMSLEYTNAFGIKCNITPLSKGFVNEFRLLGHTLNIPCKVIDIDNYSVKPCAAGSHQLDSSVLFMIHSLFGENMYSIHDDFRVSIRQEDRLQQIAIRVLEYFWNKDNLMDNYLSQVFSLLDEGKCYRVGSIRPEVPIIDWSKVTRVLF